MTADVATPTGGTPGRGVAWRANVARLGLFGATRAALFGAPGPKALRPGGHSAIVERLRTPAIVLASLGMTMAAVYVLAEPTAIQFFQALSRRDFATAAKDGLGLFPIVVTALVIDVTIVTAATRFQMHVLRREHGWASIAFAMLLFCGGTETATLAYLMFEIEPDSVSGQAAAIVHAIPSVLFWVRAGGAFVCVVFLVAAVLPLTIQRADLQRTTAALAGGSVVALLDRLMHTTDGGDREELGRVLGVYLGIFRHGTPGSAPEHAVADDELVRLVRALHAPGGGARVVDATAGPSKADGRADTREMAALPGPTTRALAAARSMHDGASGEDDGEWADYAPAGYDYGHGSGRNGNGNGNGHGHRGRGGDDRAQRRDSGPRAELRTAAPVGPRPRMAPTSGPRGDGRPGVPRARWAQAAAAAWSPAGTGLVPAGADDPDRSGDRGDRSGGEIGRPDGARSRDLRRQWAEARAAKAAPDPDRATRWDKGMAKADADAVRARREEIARELLAQKPSMEVRELARAVGKRMKQEGFGAAAVMNLREAHDLRKRITREYVTPEASGLVVGALAADGALAAVARAEDEVPEMPGDREGFSTGVLLLEDLEDFAREQGYGAEDAANG